MAGRTGNDGHFLETLFTVWARVHLQFQTILYLAHFRTVARIVDTGKSNTTAGSRG